MSKDKDPQDFLAPSHYFDYEHPRVRASMSTRACAPSSRRAWATRSPPSSAR